MNIPTQAETGLEWATRRYASVDSPKYGGKLNFVRISGIGDRTVRRPKVNANDAFLYWGRRYWGRRCL